MSHPLIRMAADVHRGRKTGITSVCSAHPVVIAAALEFARDHGESALIEATCNQVNQEGGYTGMTPAGFRSFVFAIADAVGCARDAIILGGDHLGPNPWKHLPEDDAMRKAEAMIAAFAEAGFTKLHLDTSMGCRDEPAALPDQMTAQRAARLAAVAEQHGGSLHPVYVIGTEVPVPGGALEALDHLQITTVQAVATTYQVHEKAFSGLALDDAFARVVGLVVQPGVEFGHEDVAHFDAAGAVGLSNALKSFPGIVYEAHSTDYQRPQSLRQLVSGGFSILKVGPGLTFALREALYALDNMADILAGEHPTSRLMAAMEEIMIHQPEHWLNYYNGSPDIRRIQRHFSYSDRIRYYWPVDGARSAVENLRHRLRGKRIPPSLLSQYLPWLDPALLDPSSDTIVDDIQKHAVKRVLQSYHLATRPETALP